VDLDSDYRRLGEYDSLSFEMNFILSPPVFHFFRFPIIHFHSTLSPDANDWS